MSHSNRIMKRMKQGQSILPTASLIAMDEHGRVVLIKNESGEYELPHAKLQPKQTLEDSLRQGVTTATDLQVGSLTLLSIQTNHIMEDHDVYLVNTIYYSEDFTPLETTELFDVEHLPMNIASYSRDVIDAYVSSVEASFMRYLSMHGEMF